MDEYQQVQLSSKEEIEGSVSVIPLGANTYRLGSIPWFLADKEEDIAYYGDVIEAEAQENAVLRFCRVVERSTWYHWH